MQDMTNDELRMLVAALVTKYGGRVVVSRKQLQNADLLDGKFICVDEPFFGDDVVITIERMKG